jgi:alpha-tubulin suppressor-like RCC1 family protein
MLGPQHRKAVRRVPSGLECATEISCGYHTMALTPDGMLVAWGYNNSGQCDTPDYVRVAQKHMTILM